MPKPSPRRRRRSSTGSLPVRVTSLRFNPADPSRLANALLLNASEQAARLEGKPRPFLAGIDRLSDITTNTTNTQRKEQTNDDHPDTST